MTDPHPWLAAWPALLALVPPLVVLTGVLLWFSGAARRSARLDAVWGWLGPGRAWRGAGRAWHGEVDGRAVEVTWFDRTTTVRVAGEPRIVPLGLGRSGGPRPEADGVAVALDDRHVAFAPSEGAALAFGARAGVRPAIDVLLDADQRTVRTVDLDRRGVTLLARNLRERRIHADDAQRWVGALIALAGAAEG